MTTTRVSIPVNFDLSNLKIRWSDHVLVYSDFLRKKSVGTPKPRINALATAPLGRGEQLSLLQSKPIGEGVVYGGDWEKAEKLAKQMAKMKFGKERSGLAVCEQIFIITNKEQKTMSNEVRAVIKRGSNLKVKVGRDVFEDIKIIEFIRNELRFPNEVRIDANRGYSLKQLQYIAPTLKEFGIKYLEEPVKAQDLPAAAELLHRQGLKIILDESLTDLNLKPWIAFMDVINIKLSRIGDIRDAFQLIKQAKKHGIKVVIGCSEELERGMKAIYALGLEARKAGVLLEVEGFGPLRLFPGRLGVVGDKFPSVPRWMNKWENLSIIVAHRFRQLLFAIYWFGLRLGVLGMKKTKLLSSLSLHLTKLTGKSSQKIHPKHLIFQKYQPEFLRYLHSDDSLLDIGCGNGQNSLLAAGKVRSVIGFDIDRKQLKMAESEARRRGINNAEFEYASAEKELPYDSGRFAKVLLFGVLEHLLARREVLTEVHRVLKLNGLLLLGVPNETTGWKKLQMRVGIAHFTDPDHRVEFTVESVSRLLAETGFGVLQILPTAYDTPWAGLIDVIGGISLRIYKKLLFWKWRMARLNPEESISFFVVAEKK